MQPLIPTLTFEQLRLAKKNAIKSLDSLGVELSSSTAGNLVANILGYQSWNIAKAKTEHQTVSEREIEQVVAKKSEKHIDKEIELPSSGEILQAGLMYLWTNKKENLDAAYDDIAKMLGFETLEEIRPFLGNTDFSPKALEDFASTMKKQIKKHYEEEEREDGHRASWSDPYIDLPTGTVAFLIDDPLDRNYTLIARDFNSKNTVMYADRNLLGEKVAIAQEKNKLEVHRSVYYWPILDLFEKKCAKIKSSRKLIEEMKNIHIGQLYSGIEVFNRKFNTDESIHHFYEVIKKTGKTIILRELATHNVMPDLVPDKYRSFSEHPNLKYIKPSKQVYIGEPFQKKPSIHWYNDSLHSVNITMRYDDFETLLTKCDDDIIVTNRYFEDLSNAFHKEAHDLTALSNVAKH